MVREDCLVSHVYAAWLLLLHQLRSLEVTAPSWRPCGWVIRWFFGTMSGPLLLKTFTEHHKTKKCYCVLWGWPWRLIMQNWKFYDFVIYILFIYTAHSWLLKLSVCWLELSVFRREPLCSYAFLLFIFDHHRNVYLYQYSQYDIAIIYISYIMWWFMIPIFGSHSDHPDLHHVGQVQERPELRLRRIRIARPGLNA